jgi:hypothetical protein
MNIQSRHPLAQLYGILRIALRSCYWQNDFIEYPSKTWTFTKSSSARAVIMIIVLVFILKNHFIVLACYWYDVAWYWLKLLCTDPKIRYKVVIVSRSYTAFFVLHFAIAFCIYWFSISSCIARTCVRGCREKTGDDILMTFRCNALRA